MAIKVRIEKLNERAILPSRAHKRDTGYDLTFTGIKRIEGDVIFFKTDLTVQPSQGYYFEIIPRSSISKLPLSMANSIGIIDNTYTGELIVPVRLHHREAGFDTKTNTFPFGIANMFGGKPPTILSAAELILSKKPTLFQLVLRKKYNCEFVFGDLKSTDRSDGGFGSTDDKSTKSIE